jgi:hypothetical protein
VRKVLNALPPLVPLVTPRRLMGGTRLGTVPASQIIAQEDALGPLPPRFSSSATIRRPGSSIVVKLRRRSSDGGVDLRPLEQPEIVTKFSIGIPASDDFAVQHGGLSCGSETSQTASATGRQKHHQAHGQDGAKARHFWELHHRLVTDQFRRHDMSIRRVNRVRTKSGVRAMPRTRLRLRRLRVTSAGHAPETWESILVGRRFVYILRR